MTQDQDFTDMTALITGGSRGLGLALGRELGRRGARVALVAREEAALGQATASLRAEGIAAEGIVGDIGDKRAIHAIAHQAAALLGPVDLLIHNASALGPTPLRLLLDTECEDFERVLQVNVLGPFRLSKVIAGAMALRGRGTVVHVSSDAAIEAYPRWGAYGASKAALDHLSRTWAAELEGTGVRVVAIDPGEMDTQMHADAIPDADRAGLLDPAEVARRIAAIVRDERAGVRVRADDWKAGGR